MDLRQPRLQLPPVYKRIDAPLTALTFIERAATVYPDRLAVAVDLPLPSVPARVNPFGGLTWMLYCYPHMLSMAPTRAPLAVALRGSLAR